MADYPPQAHENLFTYAADVQDDDATWMLGGCSDLDEFTVGSSHTCFLQNEKAQHRVNVKKTAASPTKNIAAGEPPKNGCFHVPRVKSTGAMSAITTLSLEVDKVIVVDEDEDTKSLTSEYEDAIDSIVDLKLELAKAHTMNDDLSMKLNRSLSDYAALSDHLEEVSKSRDNLRSEIRQQKKEARSVERRDKQELQLLQSENQAVRKRLERFEAPENRRTSWTWCAPSAAASISQPQRRHSIIDCGRPCRQVDEGKETGEASAPPRRKYAPANILRGSWSCATSTDASIAQRSLRRKDEGRRGRQMDEKKEIVNVSGTRGRNYEPSSDPLFK